MNHTLIWRMESSNKRRSVCGRFTIVKDARGSYLLFVKDHYHARAYTRTLKKARIAAADVLSGKLRL